MPNQVIKGCGHHHVALYASDFDKSVKFYTEVLGFEPICSWIENGKQVIMLDVGDGSILEIFESQDGQKDAAEKKKELFWHLCYKADDVDAAYKLAIEGGAIPKKEPTDMDIAATPERLRIRNALFLGPDGELVEFFKYL
jgi:catechol 2,3-dioxygenase-like lactoylglutathione lyase family enzyme